MAEKVIECSTHFSDAFTSPHDSKLDIQGLETRPTHGMETARANARRLSHEFEWRGDDVLAAENEAVTELKNERLEVAV